MTLRFRRLVLAQILLLSTVGAAEASLIINGDFATDLSGWGNLGVPGTQWTAGEAWLGVPGANGTSTLNQSFNLASGADAVSLVFDYNFVGPGASSPPDVFSVLFSYTDIFANSQIVTAFMLDDSSAPVSGTYSNSTALNNIDTTAPVTLSFVLFESNQGAGTRVELDNVSAEAVPEPATLALFGLGVAGLGWSRRKKA
ncbi:MAG: hypothetical protein ACI87W_000645 [Halieaceae bacterium]|jgi:hypothetical protein